jgi:hypothetical protein
LLERVADAGQFTEAIFGHERRDVALEIVQRAGGVRVGARLERVLPLELQEDGDLFENVGDLRFIHDRNNVMGRVSSAS